MSTGACHAAAAEGRSVEVVDLRAISPLDLTTVAASVRRTGRCVVVHEAPVLNATGAEVAARVERVSRLVEELTSQRAEDRVGEAVSVLVEALDADDGGPTGRAAHQGPEVDGTTRLLPRDGVPGPVPAVGAVVPGVVVATEGVDLVARPLGSAW